MRRLISVVVLIGIVAVSGVAFAADTSTVTVSATVVGTCRFNTGGTMNFGNLDPASGVDVNALVGQPAFWCTKNTGYTLTDDDGVNKSGVQHRVKGAAFNEFINYSFNYTAAGTGSGKNNPITMDIDGKILGADYVDASQDAYSDTVTLTINP